METDDKTREQLKQRRDEINDQLARIGGEFNRELDRDPEEQAIEVEQIQVPIAMVDSLRKELADVEARLVELDD